MLRELDALKGKIGNVYSRNDVALQLRMVTERLGNLGYPFDSGDPNRTMSSCGGILRINRKRWAHNDEFSHFEAAHFIDTVRIVMAHIGNPARAAEVDQLHSALVEELTADDAETDVSPEARPELAVEYMTTCEGMAGPGAVAIDDFSEEPNAEPVPRALGLAGIRPLGHEAIWDPWEVTLMGDSEVLDTMRTKAAKERARAVIEDIVDARRPSRLSAWPN
ncbi:hypothetical protein [Arthrobacter alpinus]|uniref:hypothetical protein n=1 Tax=Arthrobacter alpinus TaxID=656366 RepID=UPI00164750E4|nr:hypothetical protein [Arthrobacter alpinus]